MDDVDDCLLLVAGTLSVLLLLLSEDGTQTSSVLLVSPTKKTHPSFLVWDCKKSGASVGSELVSWAESWPPTSSSLAQSVVRTTVRAEPNRPTDPS